ncbi:agmatine deiminase family protein [bacterium]|nr:agmatine deiminase family protein [bacterium]MBU1993861.1 agmatine deiminase family protein [bacterium]
MRRFIAEFEEQSFTQIIFPHAKSDWVEYLDEAQTNFINIINAVIQYQKCLVICDNVQSVKKHFNESKNLYFVEYETNDSWARDCSVLCVEDNSEIQLMDFVFTGWGGKFEAKKDNAMSKAIAVKYSKCMQSHDFILEGGGVESNGEGIILTTSECVLNKNRNNTLGNEQITQKIKDTLGASEVLYLHHGYLAGDDTDSHIDTLARFIDAKTIMYVKCDDIHDEHYEELKRMQAELQALSKSHNFELIALPMTDPVFFEEERIPATYANFLFVNGAVLVPTYNVSQDEQALDIFRKSLPHLDVIGVDCSVLIRQHGSLHCVTMNFAKGVEIL